MYRIAPEPHAQPPISQDQSLAYLRRYLLHFIELDS
jgi:hypothetical protein